MIDRVTDLDGRTHAVRTNVEKYGPAILARRVYLIDRGRIAFEGSPRDLRADPELMRRLVGV